MTRTSVSLRCLAAAALLVVPSLVAPASAQTRCTPTRADMLGPFYTPNAPERERTGRGLVVSGRVKSASDCAPLVGAHLEWWSANTGGEYDDAHRATQVTDTGGGYRYETDVPGRYPPRPVHVHVRVTAPGHRPLVTQLYPKPEQTTLQADFVLVRE